MAFCTNCGKEISDRAAACPQCGQPQATPAAWVAQAGAAVGDAAASANAAFQKTEGRAIASLILGIASFVVWPVGLVTSILAVILGGRARKAIRQQPGLQGDGIALAGIIVGWVWLGLAILITLIFVTFAASSVRF